MREKLSPLISLLAISLAVMNLYQAIFGFWSPYISRGLHLTIALVLIFLINPLRLTEKKSKRSLIFSLDMLMAVLAAALAVYIALNQTGLLLHYGQATTADMFFGWAIIILVLEATRRTAGPALVIVVLILMVYTIFGRWMPGPLINPGASITQIIQHNFLTFYGVLGIPIQALVNMVFIYIIFAAFLMEAKVADFFRDASYTLMGTQRGGVGKVAVVSSAFVGSLSGSASGNVMITGSYTIPAMKKDGYPPVMAGAIEAAASTGGQIMPPIMGSAGFIMAAFIGVPYIKVALAAAIPAILYFLAVGASVHSSCLRYGLTGIPKEQLPRRLDVLKKSYLLSPLILVLAVLLMGYSVVRTGFYALISIILLSFVSRDTWLTPRKILRALENAGKMVLQLTATCAAAGLIMNLVLLSGLGMKTPFLVSAVSGDNLFLAVAIVGTAALVMSTGMPSNAGYIIGAVLMSSVLISEYNVPVLAAHMFVLYYAIISNITPPVSLASYAAASLAGTNLWSTGLKAFLLASSGFVIPLLFIQEPALLLQGSVGEILIALIIGVVVVISLSLALFGFFLRKLSVLSRLLLFSIPIMTLVSYYMSGLDWLRVAAVVLFVLVMIPEFLGGKFGKASQIGAHEVN